MFVIITTCAPKDAQSLLKKLLEQRVVACGNIMPTVRSLYWWKGSIQNDEEADQSWEGGGGVKFTTICFNMPPLVSTLNLH